MKYIDIENSNMKLRHESVTLNERHGNSDMDIDIKKLSRGNEHEHLKKKHMLIFYNKKWKMTYSNKKK